VTALTVRAAGAGLLIASGLMLGTERAAAMKKRCRELRRIADGLGRMESEILSLHTPMPDIFRKLRDIPFFSLLDAGFASEPLKQLWARAAKAAVSDAVCADALAALSGVVGRFDAQRQAVELAAVRAVFHLHADALEQEINGRGKSLPGLGAALGAMAAAMLF